MILKKMTTALSPDHLALYSLQGDNEMIDLNSLVGRELSIEFKGNIYCQHTGKKIKKSYAQGYSFESYMTLASLDSCLFNPELCHYDAGTCREPSWGESHCFIPHFIYLSLTSHLKVGVTRETNFPNRWIDQGASQGIKVFEAPNRKIAGLVEVELKKKYSDKTSWQAMVKNQVQQDIDLKKEAQKIVKSHQFEDLGVKVIENEDVLHLRYPCEDYPQKASQLNLDKTRHFQGKLLGIKGQYLLFEDKVFNVRRHQGYEVDLKVS